jgi:hypothetical protein
MELTTYKVLQGLTYITLLVIATYVSWKKGEKEGSVFMLQYLRENKFMGDSDYAKFMQHIRTEKKIPQIDEVSPKELKKKEKNDEDK